jgi:hypothetical protein
MMTGSVAEVKRARTRVTPASLDLLLAVPGVCDRVPVTGCR